MQAWLVSARFDSLWILLPGILASVFVVLSKTSEGPLSFWEWYLWIVAIDVAHVYATIYRTYADGAARQRLFSLLIIVPLGSWLVSLWLLSIDIMWFWRVLAYVAVFHFIRQAYGIMRLYARKERETSWLQGIDQFAIYAATLYPVIYWHTHKRSIHWFLEGDFFHGLPIWSERLAFGLWCLSIVAFVSKAAVISVRTRNLNLPKLIHVLTTYAVWYVGIVMFDNDRSFTITNVVAHGVPYFALIWAYKRKESPPWTISLWWFVLSLLLLASLEEFVWDRLLWHEVFSSFPAFQLSDDIKIWVIAMLAVPQLSHYFLDAFLWKLKTQEW
jgi:hypothetical protein